MQTLLSKQTYSHTQDCVRCGLCLPTCPTYLITGDEAESPRGRISLIKGLADGHIEPSAAVRAHLDHCLDCRACETACPSAVTYHELIEETRSSLPPNPAIQQPILLNWFTRHILPYSHRLRLALIPVRIAQAIGIWPSMINGFASRLLPKPLLKMARMLPTHIRLRPPRLRPNYTANAEAKPKSPIQLHQGCATSALSPGLNLKTIDLLNLAGHEVCVQPKQSCCGALALHQGDPHTAKVFARHNIDSLLTPDAPATLIVTNAAGCSAMLKQYENLLKDDPTYKGKAKQFASRVKDACELLAPSDLPTPPHSVPVTATIHHACHHTHAQHLAINPQHILADVKGVNITPLTEATTCCGAAGTYNLYQPHMAEKLAQRKLRHITDTGAPTCISGNIGCSMHLAAQAAAHATNITFTHPIDLLHQAHFGDSPIPETH